MVTEATGGVRHAVINESAAASTEIVAAVAGKKLRVLSLFLIAAAAVNATIEDEDGTDLIGLIPLGDNGGFVLNHNPCGWQEAPAGKALHLLLGGAIQVGGCITYQEID